MIYQKIFKPLIDKTLALVLLIIFLPFIIITAIIIKIFIGSPIFFTQRRPGLGEEIFVIYKFRTMNNKKDSNGELLSDEIRLTRVGKITRSLSLDELPQLLNVLKGEMSFIGPRPLLVEYLDLYTTILMDKIRDIWFKEKIKTAVGIIGGKLAPKKRGRPRKAVSKRRVTRRNVKRSRYKKRSAGRGASRFLK